MGGKFVTVEYARGLYENAGVGHDFDHVLRVLALAERITTAEGADVEIVRTAALLHDVAESVDRQNHHLLGAQRAREILAGWPNGFVDAVCHAIEAHRFRHEPAPATLEAKVLSDADKLDAIGAIGIARAFVYAGALDMPLWRKPWREIAAEDGDARIAPSALGGAYTPVHEFVYKLDRIPERLYTATARTIAEERRVYMREFFQRLDEEVAGER
jgi:uncharacterized protein